MRSLKTVMAICLQNMRKWRTDYRIWVIAALVLVMVWIYIDDVRRIASGLGTSMPIWIYPFLYSQFHTKLIFTLPVVLLFCNAPFVDGNQMFVYMRTGKTKWLCGQIIYIAVTGAIYYVFLIAATLISSVLAGGEMSMEWGKTLVTTANSNAALYFGSPFIMVSPIVTAFFSPLSAIGFTLLTSWLCAVMIGLIILFCNLATKIRGLGITITSLLVVLSAFADNGFPMLLPFSPISWNTLDKIDVGGMTTNPTFGYCVTAYLFLILLLITGIFVFGKKQAIDLKGH